LPELVALASLAEVVATADAGPRHVAAAAGARLVVVAGPTDPRHTADGTSRTTLLRVPVECGPCHRETCPLTGAARHRCMTLVDPGRVAQAIRGGLGEGRRPPRERSAERAC
jgi:ADP-heptose:LPS heptosyltransferase